jgi:hypothetical protein
MTLEGPKGSCVATYVLVVLDLVPGPPVTASVPDDLGALGELVEVGTGTSDGNGDNASGVSHIALGLANQRKGSAWGYDDPYVGFLGNITHPMMG